jgi:hypothetical protein
MNFKTWLEAKQFQGIKKSDIDWWANYSRNKIFPTEQSARDWVFERRQFADKQSYASVFGVDGEDYNRAFAQAIPIYQSGKSFKIGKRIREDHRLKLKNLEIKLPDWNYINQVAQANGESDYEIHKVRWIPIRFTVADTNDYYLMNQKGRIEELAYAIKNNGWIEAVIYDFKSKNIIEGQHRARAMKILGFNTVPGVGIEYES